MSFRRFSSFSASLKMTSGEFELVDVQDRSVQACLFKEVFIGRLKGK